jgi:hypothetical protein
MRAAFGKILITPPDFLGGPFGRPMAGYTPIPTCNSKYDDIYANALLLETPVLGNVPKYLLLISMDILQIPLMVADYIKEKVNDYYPIYPSAILVHATHTHKSFDMTGTFSRGGNWPGLIKGIITGATRADDKYKVWIAKQIVKMVGQMMADLTPAKIAWKKFIPKEPLTINRRRHEISPQPFGVIAVKNLSTGQLIGFLMNMGAHPTTLTHRHHQMSGDFPGRAVWIVDRETKGQIKAAYFNGPAGDIAPYYAAGGFKFHKRNPEGQLVSAQAYSFTRFYGYLLGKLGLKTAQEIPDNEYCDRINFQSYVKTFWVPMNDYKKHRFGGKKVWVYINNRIVHIVKRYILFPLALIMGDSHEPNFPGFAAKHFKDKSYWGTTINLYTKVQYITLNAFHTQSDIKPAKILAIIGTPGELFESIAEKIYTNTPAGKDNTFIFQAANDWIAYLFPIDQYVLEGGYEPLASFSPVCGAYVYAYYRKILAEIAAGINAGYY